MINNESIAAPNAANDAQAQAELRASQAQQTVNRYHRVFNNPDGIMVIADLVAYFKTSVPFFAQANPNMPTDVYRAGALEGQRSVLLRIQQMLLQSPQGDANAADAARPPVKR